MDNFLPILFAAAGTLGYAVIFNIPIRLLPFSALTGALGFLVFSCIPNSVVLACFCAALTVGICGEFFSRILRDAATLFIIPGILPLVPGAKMYRMTLSLLEKDFDTAVSLFIEVLTFAGCIALALLIVTSSTRFFFKTKHRINTLRMQRALKKHRHRKHLSKKRR